MFAQTAGVGQTNVATTSIDQLDQIVRKYEMPKGGVIDGLAVLSQDRSLRLHLGAEELPRERFQSPRDHSIEFPVRLDNKTVRDIINALCESDPRYTWSVDGETINVYPRARANDKTDLLNLYINRIELGAIPNPNEALTPLSKLFPGAPIGYMQLGGENSYGAPWTVTFENLTIRQLMGRITEHIGPHAVWTWQGGKEGGFFTFLRGGFHTEFTQ